MAATASRKRLPASVFTQRASVKAVFLSVLAAGAMLLPVSAQDTNATARLTIAKAPAKHLWSDDVVGSGYLRGAKEAGIAIGGGVAAPRVGNKSLHDLLLAKIHYGWVFSDVQAKGKWYAGNWALLEEVFVGGQVYPVTHYVVGETTLLRYSLATGTRWVPFVDGGIGILATSIANPDLGSPGEFNGQGGLGVNYFWRDDVAFYVQYRFTHYSNANIRSPNQGLNDHMFYVGVTWLF